MKELSLLEYLDSDLLVSNRTFTEKAKAVHETSTLMAFFPLRRENSAKERESTRVPRLEKEAGFLGERRLDGVTFRIPQDFGNRVLLVISFYVGMQ